MCAGAATKHQVESQTNLKTLQHLHLGFPNCKGALVLHRIGENLQLLGQLYILGSCDASCLVLPRRLASTDSYFWSKASTYECISGMKTQTNSRAYTMRSAVN